MLPRESAKRSGFHIEFSHLYGLLLPGDPSSLIQRRRALLIISRGRLVAGLFAALTPLWIPIDLFVFPLRLARDFSILRLFASLAFVGLVVGFRSAGSMRSAHRMLVLLLLVPTVFFLISQPLLAEFDIKGQLSQTVAAGYAFLPFVMLAGLSMFPIAAAEGAALSVPLIGAYLTMMYHGYHVMPFESHLGALWLLFLLSVVATLSGMSQLHFMQRWISQDAHDAMTKAYTRRIGEELLEVQFELSCRNHAPLSLAFADLDSFKQINDRYGHEEGDAALRRAGESLRRVLRRGDILIRWGGEEFVVVMPGTDLPGLRVALQRLQEAGLGQRPDGSPLTASLGGAERIHDGCGSWAEMVEKADYRMYAAKQAGKNRIVLADGASPIARHSVASTWETP